MTGGGLDKEKLLKQITGAGKLYEEAQSRGGAHATAAEERASSLCRDLADSIKAEWRREDDLAASGPPAPTRKPKGVRASERTVASRMSNDYGRFEDLDSDTDAEGPPSRVLEEQPVSVAASAKVCNSAPALTSTISAPEPVSDSTPRMDQDSVQAACSDEAQRSNDSNEIPIDVPALTADEIAMAEAAEVALYAEAARCAHLQSSIDYRRFDKAIEEESDADDEDKGFSETYKVAHRLAGVVDEVRAGKDYVRAGQDRPCRTDTVRIGTDVATGPSRGCTKYDVDYSRFSALGTEEEEDSDLSILTSRLAADISDIGGAESGIQGGRGAESMSRGHPSSRGQICAAGTHRRRCVRKSFGSSKDDQSAGHQSDEPLPPIVVPSFALESMD